MRADAFWLDKSSVKDKPSHRVFINNLIKVIQHNLFVDEDFIKNP